MQFESASYFCKYKWEELRNNASICTNVYNHHLSQLPFGGLIRFKYMSLTIDANPLVIWIDRFSDVWNSMLSEHNTIMGNYDPDREIIIFVSAPNGETSSGLLKRVNI